MPARIWRRNIRRSTGRQTPRNSRPNSHSAATKPRRPRPTEAQIETQRRIPPELGGSMHLFHFSFVAGAGGCRSDWFARDHPLFQKSTLHRIARMCQRLAKMGARDFAVAAAQLEFA